MGTRNLVAVVMDGEFKVAQYGQWDGYPSGQGSTVKLFIEMLMVDSMINMEIFKAKLRSTRFFQSTEDTENLDVDEFPQLHRNTGAEILQLVFEHSENKFPLVDSSDFGNDSLFCEYAYVLDVDYETLEVYSGFSKKPAIYGRWTGDHMVSIPSADSYYGVERVEVIPFREVARLTMEDYVLRLDKSVEDWREAQEKLAA